MDKEQRGKRKEQEKLAILRAENIYNLKFFLWVSLWIDEFVQEVNGRNSIVFDHLMLMVVVLVVVLMVVLSAKSLLMRVKKFKVRCIPRMQWHRRKEIHQKTWQHWKVSLPFKVLAKSAEAKKGTVYTTSCSNKESCLPLQDWDNKIRFFSNLVIYLLLFLP